MKAAPFPLIIPPGKNAFPAYMCIGLVRHGLTLWNLERRFQGKRDIPLCEQGLEQVLAWSDSLESFGFDRILTSPLSRAKETARLLASVLKIEAHEKAGLRELDFGQWEGKQIEEIEKINRENIISQEVQGWHFKPPGGESRLDVYQRAAGVLSEACTLYPGERILVVTHHTVLKTLAYGITGCRFMPDEPRILKAYRLHLIHIEAGSVRLEPNVLKLKKI